MQQHVRGVALAVLVAVTVAGCADAGTSPEAAADAGAEAAPVASAAPTPSALRTAASPSPSPTPTPPAAPAEPVEPAPTDDELAAAGVNELGRVLVGEWHIIGDADGEYRTSRDTFRRQLQELYDRGYRPVTQEEFLDGTFPIPLGTSPLLLTFDDSTRGQFALDDAGVPTPDSAVGIMERFAAEHDGWRATAVFAYNFPEPFGDDSHAEKLRWLVDNGYELSNHSVGHADLSTLSSSELVANLAENQARLHEVVPGTPVPSLTLPLGKWPDDRAAAASGSADGVSYLHELVYLVGSDPTRSPHHVDFDPMAIQRVPAHAVVGTGPEWFWDWLDRLDRDGLRFVSDGRADVVTYPVDLAEIAGVDPAHQSHSYGSP